MNEGCIAVLDSNGVPTEFVAPSTYAGPSDSKSHSLRYGPTPTSCVLVSRSKPLGPSPVESVSRFDVVSGDLVDVPVALPDLEGSLLELDLVTLDGSVVDVVVERQGRSYGRSFLARVSGGRVISQSYLPARSTFTRHYQFVAKRGKDGLKRALRIDRTTGEATELLLARSTKARLAAHSVAPDHSLVLVAETLVAQLPRGVSTDSPIPVRRRDRPAGRRVNALGGRGLHGVARHIAPGGDDLQPGFRSHHTHSPATRSGPGR